MPEALIFFEGPFEEKGDNTHLNRAILNMNVDPHGLLFTVTFDGRNVDTEAEYGFRDARNAGYFAAEVLTHQRNPQILYQELKETTYA